MNRSLPNTYKSPGFTIIELAVVILIVGILAALSIFAFGAWRTNVAETEAENEANRLASTVRSFSTWGPGFPSWIPDDFQESENITVTQYAAYADKMCAILESKTVPGVVIKATMTVDDAKVHISAETSCDEIMLRGSVACAVDSTNPSAIGSAQVVLRLYNRTSTNMTNVRMVSDYGSKSFQLNSAVITPGGQGMGMMGPTPDGTVTALGYGRVEARFTHEGEEKRLAYVFRDRKCKS